MLISAIAVLGNYPYINNYHKSTYKGGTESWDIASTKNGIIYIANNDGLLIYNGSKWQLHKLPNKTIVRSIEVDTTHNRIYVGGQDEFGYFEINNNGTLKYIDLKSLFPLEYKSVEDIWDINIINSTVYFRSVDNIFKYDGNEITVLTTTSKSISYFEVVDNVIYYHEPNGGIYKIKGSTPELLPGSLKLISGRISDILMLPDQSILFVSESEGIFKYNNQQFTKFITSNQFDRLILNSIVYVEKDILAVGTTLGGLLFFNTSGIHLFTITKTQGLQTNSIIKVTKDSKGSLWLGTSNGIDQVLLNSHYSIMYPDGDLKGAVYTIALHNDLLYIGTNNGLYSTPWFKSQLGYYFSEFKLVNNSLGQVWGLDIVNNELMMGHNNGSYVIKNNQAIKISNEKLGSWKHLYHRQLDMMIVGNYHGIDLYQKSNNKWAYHSTIEDFNESARILNLDSDENIWVSHPYRGVYKIHISKNQNTIHSTVTKYDKNQGLPSLLGNYLAKINNNIYISGENGTYVYNKKIDRLEKEIPITNILGTENVVRRFFQNHTNDLWYVMENSLGLLIIDDKAVNKYVENKALPFLIGKMIGGFENIFIPSANIGMICTAEGVIMLDKEKIIKKNQLLLRIDQITNLGTKDSLLYGGYGSVATPNDNFHYLQNSFRFILGTDLISPLDPILYSYKINNGEWSNDQESNEINIARLKPGTYTISFRANGSNNITSKTVTYKISINSPWYLRWYAVLIFSFLIFMLFRSFWVMSSKKQKIENTILKQEKEASEAQVKSLENDKLETEISFKNKELALATMHIVQKNETLASLRDELSGIIKSTPDKETKSNLKKLISIVSDDEKLEEDWDSFATYFDSVHTDFLKRLKEHHPQLTPKDLKLSAYLRMNLSTKEIAPLLNISVRGIEISRYRLRKKLDLNADVNLSEYMMQF